MPLAVTEINELQQYLQGMMARADHHAENVKEIAMTLTGVILWRKDGEEHIRVLAQGGKTKNVLWVYISGIRYAFSFNESAGEIEMRIKSTHGQVLHSFSNKTLVSEVIEIFEKL